MTGNLLSDPKVVDIRAQAIMAARGVTAEELVILAGHFMHTVSSSIVQHAYGEWANGDRDYRRDFARVVEAVRRTGLPPERGNAIAMAWAMRSLQDMKTVQPEAKA